MEEIMINKSRLIKLKWIVLLMCILILTACNKVSNDLEDNKTTTNEKEVQAPLVDEVSEDVNSDSTEPTIYVPDKETVLYMREIALEGMTKEQIDSLTNQVKTANLELENSIFYDNLWEHLSDPKDLTWNYLDETGDIQIGWAFETTDVTQEESGLTKEEYEQTYGKPVMVRNDKNAEIYIKIIDELSSTINSEELKTDLLLIKDYLLKAKETHDVKEIEKIYEILHDMDYFLLRYGIEEVGYTVKDHSTLSKYYGVLTIYQSMQNADSNLDSKR